MIQLPRLLVLSLVVLLGACGGSSDGGPLPVDFATITRDNAPQVAGAVMGSAFESDGLGDFAWLLALGDPSSPPQAGATAAKAGAAAAVHAKRLLEQGRSDGALHAPIAPTTSPCSVGGTVELSGDIATTQTLTPGDTITFAFTDCDDGITVVSGTFSMTITTFEGDFVGGSFAFGVDAAIEAFRVSVGGEAAASIDGDASIGLDATSLPTLAVTVDSDSLSVSDGESAYVLERYSLTQTSDSLTGAYTVSVAGRASSADLDGVVDFETAAAFESADGGTPVTGRIEITGDAGATIAVIVLDDTAIRLEVDEDGDGTPDAVVDTTWEALT